MVTFLKRVLPLVLVILFVSLLVTVPAIGQTLGEFETELKKNSTPMRGIVKWFGRVIVLCALLYLLYTIFFDKHGARSGAFAFVIGLVVWGILERVADRLN
jgi:hypothetical protein